MPGLEAFGRRWQIASDDLIVPGFLSAVAETGFLIFVAVLMALIHKVDCPENHTLTTWCNAFALAVHLLLIANSAAMCWVATLGTPLDIVPRRRISWLIYTGLVLTAGEVGVLIAWSIALSQPWDGCHRAYHVLVITLTAVGWAFVICKSIVLVMFYDSAGKHHQIAGGYVKPWKRRCRLMFCCAGAEAVIPRSVPQKLGSKGHGREVVSDDLVRTLSYYSKYYMGSYGMTVLSAHHPIMCCCLICRHLPVSGKTHRVGDPCCFNAATIKTYTDLGDEHIVFASYRNKLYLPAYFIAVDHAKQAVVLAFRGTQSIDDAVTDLAVRLKEMDIPGLGTVHCHSGFLESTKNLLTDLTEHGHLTRLLDVEFPKYDLVIVGHSLGAAVATMTSLFLYGKYGARLRCFAYAPPSMFSKKDHWVTLLPNVTSCILWKDVVPRLNFRAIVRWRDDLVRALAHCRVSKWHVITAPYLNCNRLWGCGGGCCRSAEAAKDIVWPVDAGMFAGVLEEGGGGTEGEPIKASISSPNDTDNNVTSDVGVGGGVNSTSSQPRPSATTHPDPPILGTTTTAPQQQLLPTSSVKVSSKTTNVAFHLWRRFLEGYAIAPEDRQRALTIHESEDAKLAAELAVYPQLYPPGKIVHLLKKEKVVEQRETIVSAYAAVWAEPEHFSHIVTSPAMWWDHMPWSLHKALERLCLTMAPPPPPSPPQQQPIPS